MKWATGILVALALVLASPALALADSQSYSYTIPAVGDVYSGIHVLSGGLSHGVRHRYSGGKDIVMQVVKAIDFIGLGNSYTVSPGGSSAPLKTLWNNPGATRDVRIRLNSAFGVVVTVLAEGTWYWNY